MGPVPRGEAGERPAARCPRGPAPGAAGDVTWPHPVYCNVAQCGVPLVPRSQTAAQRVTLPRDPREGHTICLLLRVGRKS